MMNGCMGGMGSMMNSMGSMMGLWLFSGLLLIGLITFVVIFLLRGSDVGSRWRGRASDALEVLNGRLASGDIDVQEYEQRRRLLTQQ